MRLVEMPMYGLNLNRRQDRKLRAWGQFRQQGLKVTRLAAPDAAGMEDARGWITPGIRACCAAHRLAWREGAKAGAEAVIVFEDDVVLCGDFRQRLEGINLPEDWEVFYFGCLFGSPGPELAENGLLRVRHRSWDNHAYAIRLSFARMVSRRQAVFSRKTRPLHPGEPPANDTVMADFHSAHSAWSVWPPMAWQTEGLSNTFDRIRGNYHPDGRQRYQTEAIGHLPWENV